jgi:gluconokinase
VSAFDRVLAVDIGTSSVRASVFDPQGAVTARAQIGYPTSRPAPYREEQDPDLVRRETYRAIAECLAGAGADRPRIGALAFSSQLYSLIALDAGDRPLTPSWTWADGRAEPQADALRGTPEAAALYRATGCPIDSMFPLAKLKWMGDEQPEVFRQARRFASIKEYAVAPLLGEWVVDHSVASATGLFDIHAHRWDPDALAVAGIGEAQLAEPLSGLSALPLRAGSPLSGCGLADGVQVFLGGGDGPLANLGSGASSAGAINIDLGTSGAVRRLSDRPRLDPQARTWCFCLTEDLWVQGGIVTNVGNAYQWLGDDVVGAAGGDRGQAYDLLNSLADRVAPGAQGLSVVPYLRKVRSPYWDGRLKGAMYGLTADHSLAHMARALLEAIAFDLRTIVGLIETDGPTAQRLFLTGGLCRSPVLPQLLANVLGRELFVPAQGEGSLAGAAICALRGFGRIDGLRFAGAPAQGTVHTPDPESERAYAGIYRRHERLVAMLQRFESEQAAVQ